MRLRANISHLSDNVEHLSNMALVGALSCSTVIVGGFTAL